jgi:hypothetical protein
MNYLCIFPADGRWWRRAHPGGCRCGAYPAGGHRPRRGAGKRRNPARARRRMRTSRACCSRSPVQPSQVPDWEYRTIRISALRQYCCGTANFPDLPTGPTLAAVTCAARKTAKMCLPQGSRSAPLGERASTGRASRSLQQGGAVPDLEPLRQADIGQDRTAFHRPATASALAPPSLTCPWSRRAAKGEILLGRNTVMSAHSALRDHHAQPGPAARHRGGRGTRAARIAPGDPRLSGGPAMIRTPDQRCGCS